MKYEVEICCGGYKDALNAAVGGAKRIELNSALHLGGLTPSLASLILTRQNTDLKIIAMVRPRGAGFNYNENEFQVMLEDARLLLEHGAHGIAFGFLDESNNIELAKTEAMVALIKSHGKEAVFHRAFDCVGDGHRAIKQLVDLGVDRVLTSGMQPTAYQGLEFIASLQELYGHQIEILAGSGINADNACTIVNQANINQIHSSAKSWCQDVTTTTRNLSFAYNPEMKNGYEIVDAKLVGQLVASLCQNG